MSTQVVRKLIISLLVVLILSACGTSPTTRSETPIAPNASDGGPVSSEPSDASTPITGQLTLSKLPLLNEPVELTFTFSSILDAPATKAWIVLPDGAHLLEGDLAWSGDLTSDQSQTLSVTFEFIEAGNWTLEARARHELDNGDVWGDSAYLYLFVSETDSHLGFSSSPNDLPGEIDSTPPPNNLPYP